jgi:hypothetical protein
MFLLNFFASLWKDLDPEPYKIITDPEHGRIFAKKTPYKKMTKAVSSSYIRF